MVNKDNMPGKQGAKILENEIRDPIHGFITPSRKEMRVIDSQIFQRLRRIRQLAMAYLVYPGATHTRFEHSLGTLSIVGNIALKLCGAGHIRESDIEAIRLAGLLHDLGHGPFSHISEYLLVKHFPETDSNIEEIHEDITSKLIERSDDIKKILGVRLRDSVLEILRSRDLKKDIINGPLDADKLDYLLRDAYYAGVKYGEFDLPKILESMTVIGKGPSARLGITEEGIHAVEQYVMAKHHMTIQVYRHRVRAITDAMIIRGIELAINANDRTMKALYEYKNTESYLRNYVEWWDQKVIDHILGCGNRKSMEIFRCLFLRKLFKRIHRRKINEREIQNLETLNRFLKLSDDDRIRLEREISKIKDIRSDPDFVILNIDSIENPTYRPPSSEMGEQEIQVLYQSGISKYLKDVDDSIMNLKNVEDRQQYIEVYAQCPKLESLTGKQKERKFEQIDTEIRKILYGN
jgi:HD superfamily phosphohydrolase